MAHKDPVKRREYLREWHRKHPGYGKTANRAHRKRIGADAVREYTRKQTRSWTIRVRHGMTIEQYQALLTLQGNACATCGSDNPGNGRDWRIDHCHTSKKVRGLLCHSCNVALGLVKDNKTTLHNMLNYLERLPWIS